MKKLKSIPRFNTEKEERKFWLSHDSTDYIDERNLIKLHFPNLKRSTKTITLRLPESLLDSLKALANKRDVPYQSLMKILLAEKLNEEMGRSVRH